MTLAAIWYLIYPITDEEWDRLRDQAGGEILGFPVYHAPARGFWPKPSRPIETHTDANKNLLIRLVD